MILTARRRMLAATTRCPSRRARRRSGSRSCRPSRASRASHLRPRRRARRRRAPPPRPDITASIGEPVRAIADGTVIYGAPTSARGAWRLDPARQDRALHQPEARAGRHLRLYSAHAERRSSPVTCTCRPTASPRVTGSRGRDHRLVGRTGVQFSPAAPAPRDPRRRSLHQSGALPGRSGDPAKGDDDLSYVMKSRASARLIWTGGLASPPGAARAARGAKRATQPQSWRTHFTCIWSGRGRGGPTVDANRSAAILTVGYDGAAGGAAPAPHRDVRRAGIQG